MPSGYFVYKMHFLIFLSLFLFPYYPFSLHFLPTQTHVLFTILSTFTFANSSISERVNNGILLLLLFEVCIVLILKILLIPLCLHFVINVLRICLVVLCFVMVFLRDRICRLYTLSLSLCVNNKNNLSYVISCFHHFYHFALVIIIVVVSVGFCYRFDTNIIMTMMMMFTLTDE